MTEILDEALPEAIRAGVPAIEFADWTLAEVMAQIQGYSRRQKDLRRLLSETAYNTAVLVGEAFAGQRRSYRDVFPDMDDTPPAQQAPKLLQARVEAYAARRSGEEGVTTDG